MIKKDCNNLIYMNKNDSGKIEVAVPCIESNYTIYFGVCEPSNTFDYSIIKKVYSQSDVKDGKLIINLDPQDTEFILPGTYYWSLKLVTYKKELEPFDLDVIEDTVDTLVSRKKFVIME